MNKILVCLTIFGIFVSCGEIKWPDCDTHDQCNINELCSKKTSKCEQPFPLPPEGVHFVKGSMMSPCLKWNDTETGKPVFQTRVNPWCVSGIEQSTECSDGSWTMLCK